MARNAMVVVAGMSAGSGNLILTKVSAGSTALTLECSTELRLFLQREVTLSASMAPLRVLLLPCEVFMFDIKKISKP
jgi:hypothetical protein